MVEFGVDDERLHHVAAIGDGGGNHHHVERNHLDVVLTETSDRQQRKVLIEVVHAADRAGGGARKIDRDVFADPPSGHPGKEPVRSEFERGAGKRYVARPGEHGCQISTTERAVVVLDRIVGLWRKEFTFIGPEAFEIDDTVVEGDTGREHLERGTRHVALLIGVG